MTNCRPGYGTMILGYGIWVTVLLPHRSMRMFGHAYLLETLRPLMARVLSTPDVLYEVRDEVLNV